jgi:hypothetical protein
MSPSRTPGAHKEERMDITKCNALKRELATQPDPQVVPIDRFFDGNDDLGSIGCITELDPGTDSWPFTDTVLGIGSIPPAVLQECVADLQPDEGGPADPKFLSPGLSDEERRSTLVVWWD